MAIQYNRLQGVGPKACIILRGVLGIMGSKKEGLMMRFTTGNDQGSLDPLHCIVLMESDCIPSPASMVRWKEGVA